MRKASASTKHAKYVNYQKERRGGRIEEEVEGGTGKEKEKEEEEWTEGGERDGRGEGGGKERRRGVEGRKGWKREGGKGERDEGGSWKR